LFDYFNPSITCIVGLDDGAGMLIPSVEYRIYETVLLRLAGTFIWGGADNQFSLMPFTAAVSGRISVYF
jgi:hypothetical protein